ncbi:MAG TPA: oligosaccharide flippase family protein [Stellaceae bacterium]|nr:oligosaccharide flippase family protein [Stellaceae bacterium]
MAASPAAATLNAGRWRAAIEPIVRHGGWFGFFLVLAPIIGPRGYGIFAIALSGVAVVEALLVEPVAATLARLDSRDDRYLSTALVTAVGTGAAVSLLLYLAAGQFAAMLDEAPLGDIAQTLSLLPVLGGLTAVPTALLRRRGKAGPLVAATTAGLAAGGGIAVALAWSGAGAWSLVVQIVAQRLVECAVVWGMAARRIGLVWSPPHFGELFGALDLGALGRVWPVISRQAPSLLIGLVLGPVATGLYVLAARFAEALEDILLAVPKPVRRALLADWARQIGEPLRRLALPAILSSLLLPVALPPIVDIRWWGAVLPAQILLIRLIPAAAITARAAAVGARNESRWQAIEAVGGVAVTALAAAYGLTAIAAAVLAYAICITLTGLWPIRREFGSHWRHLFAGAARPLFASAATGLILYPIVEPVALALTPAPALCLLGAIGLLCYLLLSGNLHGLRLPAFTLRRGLRPVKPA